MSIQDSKEVPQMQPTLCENLQEADKSNVKSNPNIAFVSPEENGEDFLPDIEVGECSPRVNTTTNHMSLHLSGFFLFCFFFLLRKCNTVIPFLCGH